MSEVKKIINFNDEELKIIKDDINSVFNKKDLSTSFKHFFISSKYKRFLYIIRLIGFIFFIVGGPICLIVFRENILTALYSVLIIFGINTTIIMSVRFLAIKQVFNNKIKNAFCQYNDKYIKMAAHNACEQLEIKAISNSFTIVPEKFLVISAGINYSVWTEKVLVGNVNKQDFNCGTMIEKIVRVQKTGKTTTRTTTYNRYLYFTCYINTQDFVTTIKPENLVTRIMGSNRGDQLESPDFEKLFSLDYRDPIKLRKLLVPKVMSNMIDLAATQKPLPYIFINEKQVTLMYPYMNITSPYTSSGNLLNLIIKNNTEEGLLKDVLDMLDFTLNIVVSSYAWISSLQLNTKLIFKN